MFESLFDKYPFFRVVPAVLCMAIIFKLSSMTTAELEDDFDAEHMAEAERRHKANFLTMARQMRLQVPDCLPLSAGSCTLCRSCSYPDRPCRFPAKMLSSMEAYGLLVSEVCTMAGLKYYYGPKTLTYSSCILWKEAIKP